MSGQQGCKTLIEFDVARMVTDADESEYLWMRLARQDDRQAWTPLGWR